MSAAPALQTIGLAVGYAVRRKQCAVLKDLNLSVQPGELICLLGPNGIGKSTLLRTISKIQPALAGSVQLGGVDLRELNAMEIARRLGVVLTERVEAGALTGRRVVELGRYPHLGWTGSLSARDHDVVEWAIEAVGAQHIALRDNNKLSDGERQRLMIARALAQEPLILILDEPTAFLDVPSRVELMGLLRHLAREENLAIVVSTHDLELALRMADTVWLVMTDHSLHSGAPEDVIAAGQVEAAFRSGNIRFHAEERAFRLVGGSRGRAAVQGTGLNAVLAGAVLEREGYEIVAEPQAEFNVVVQADPLRWEASYGVRVNTGSSFAALAEFARMGQD